MQQEAKLFHVENNTIDSVAKLYNKTEESLADDVLNLKNWMKGQHHLPEILGKKTTQT